MDIQKIREIITEEMKSPIMDFGNGILSVDYPNYCDTADYIEELYAENKDLTEECVSQGRLITGLDESLAELEQENDRLRESLDTYRKSYGDELRRSNEYKAIIAEKVLKWQWYHPDGNKHQRIYAPSQKDADSVFPGESLWKLVDQALAKKTLDHHSV